MALKDYQRAAMERFGEWYRILEKKKPRQRAQGRN